MKRRLKSMEYYKKAVVATTAATGLIGGFTIIGGIYAWGILSIKSEDIIRDLKENMHYTQYLEDKKTELENEVYSGNMTIGQCEENLKIIYDAGFEGYVKEYGTALQLAEYDKSETLYEWGGMGFAIALGVATGVGVAGGLLDEYYSDKVRKDPYEIEME